MREISILKKRILQYIDFKRDSKYQFYQNTGVSNGILSQKNGLSEDSIMRFFSYYSDCNPVWFITGKGDMEIAKSNVSSQKPNVSEQNGDIILLKNELIDSLKNQLNGQNLIIENQQITISILNGDRKSEQKSKNLLKNINPSSG